MEEGVIDPDVDGAPAVEHRPRRLLRAAPRSKAPVLVLFLLSANGFYSTVAGLHNFELDMAAGVCLVGAGISVWEIVPEQDMAEHTFEGRWILLQAARRRTQMRSRIKAYCVYTLLRVIEFVERSPCVTEDAEILRQQALRQDCRDVGFPFGEILQAWERVLNDGQPFQATTMPLGPGRSTTRNHKRNGCVFPGPSFSVSIK